MSTDDIFQMSNPDCSQQQRQRQQPTLRHKGPPYGGQSYGAQSYGGPPYRGSGQCTPYDSAYVTGPGCADECYGPLPKCTGKQSYLKATSGCGCLMILLSLLLVIAILGVSVVHYREGPRQCTYHEEHDWRCPAVFQVDPLEAENIEYSPIASGPELALCFWGQLTYFKVWAPVLPYPCLGSDEFIDIGEDHCMDMISSHYHRKHHLISKLFCVNATAVCIYHDECSEYAFVSHFNTNVDQIQSEEEKEEQGVEDETTNTHKVGKPLSLHKHEDYAVELLNERSQTDYRAMKEALGKKTLYEWVASQLVPKPAKKTLPPKPQTPKPPPPSQDTDDQKPFSTPTDAESNA